MSLLCPARYNHHRHLLYQCRQSQDVAIPPPRRPSMSDPANRLCCKTTHDDYRTQCRPVRIRRIGCLTATNLAESSSDGLPAPPARPGAIAVVNIVLADRCLSTPSEAQRRLRRRMSSPYCCMAPSSDQNACVADLLL